MNHRVVWTEAEVDVAHVDNGKVDASHGKQESILWL